VTETGENLLTSLRFLSRALGLEIVAEGVETEEQLGLLQQLSYDMVQGYLLSKPIPAEDLAALLSEKSDWAGIVQAQKAA
ncbi:MAG: EAL domain-containing protein, partial [Pseudomonadota bacterium]